MVHTAPLGRTLPIAPVIDGATANRAGDDDLECASTYPTPRPPHAVDQLTHRILIGTNLAKRCAAWGVAALGLWIAGTAIALVLTKLVPTWGGSLILLLGFGGLGTGLGSGLVWIAMRWREARIIAREGQLLVGIATYRREHDTLGGELSQLFAKPLGETQYCILFSIGFIRHEVWVPLPGAPAEGKPHHVLVHPGAHCALVFDALGRAHVGEVQRMRIDD